MVVELLRDGLRVSGHGLETVGDGGDALAGVAMSAHAMAIRYPASATTTSATVMSVRVSSMASLTPRAGRARSPPCRASATIAPATGSMVDATAIVSSSAGDVRGVPGDAGRRRERLGRVPLDRPRGEPRAVQQVHGKRHEHDQRRRSGPTHQIV